MRRPRQCPAGQVQGRSVGASVDLAAQVHAGCCVAAPPALAALSRAKCGRGGARALGCTAALGPPKGRPLLSPRPRPIAAATKPRPGAVVAASESEMRAATASRGANTHSSDPPSGTRQTPSGRRETRSWRRSWSKSRTAQPLEQAGRRPSDWGTPTPSSYLRKKLPKETGSVRGHDVKCERMRGGRAGLQPSAKNR